jgi:putative ABC transport system permease protein
MGAAVPRWAEAVYSALLRLYPGPFRDDYASEMRAAFRARWRDEVSGWGLPAVPFAASLYFDTITTALEEQRLMLFNDLRYALRTLRLSPAFTLTAVLTLALGVGATSSIFSVVDAVALRPLPYPNPKELMVLVGNVQRTQVERRGNSYPDYLDWKSQSRSFAAMAAADSGTGVLQEGEPERVNGEFVSPDYFRILGITPMFGRLFTADDDVPGRAVVLLSHRIWQRRFNSDPRVVGRAVRINSRSFTVIGVLPPGFTGITDTAEMWTPFAAMMSESFLKNRGTRGFQALARLAPNATQSSAQAEMNTISKALETAYPATNEKRGVEVSPLEREIFGDIRPTLWTLMGAVALVLLLACVNVANLQVARAEARQRELAVRTALGAGRGRLIRQLMTESFLVAGLGAALGFAIATAAVPALVAISPVELPTFAQPAVNMTVLLFTVALALAAGIALGIAPALHAPAAHPQDALRGTGRGTSSKAAQRLRGSLVIAEVSVALVLLAGAGLLVESLRRLTAIKPGFNPDRLVGLMVGLPRMDGPAAAAGDSNPAAGVTGREVLARVRALPGIESAAIASDMPLGGDSSAVFYAAEGQPVTDAQSRPRAYVHRVTPTYFATTGITIESGRTFLEEELDARDRPVVIVSSSLARRFWPGADPIGKRIRFGAAESTAPWMSIVGVTNEVKHRGLPDNPTPDPDIYLPFSARQRTMSLLVRAPNDSAPLTSAIRAAVRELEPGAVVYNSRTMRERVARQTARQRFAGWLMGVFAGTALLLATVGLYGVLAYTVTQRTQELGIRIALGADRANVLTHVVRAGMVMVGIGLAIGLAAAIGLARLARTQLYGVSPSDPLTLAGVIAVLAAASLAACLIPAMRATRIDPLVALRQE